MADATIKIEGLAEFRRDLGRMDRALTRGVRDVLRASAEIVAGEVRDTAPRASGRYAASVRAFTSGASAGVRVTARADDGYPYPRRLEYEGFPRGTATVRKAVKSKRREVEGEADKLVDTVAAIWSGTASGRQWFTYERFFGGT